MGVKGAAIATVLAQHIAAVTAWILHRKMDCVLQFNLKDLKPDGPVLKAICSVGSSATVKQGAGAVVLICVNMVLVRFNEVSVAVYGAFNRLGVLFLTPTWAIQDVLVILAAYNFGIKNRDRLKHLFIYSLCDILVIVLAGWVVLAAFPVPLLKIFGAGEDMTALGKTALPVLACFLPFQAGASTVSAMLQGLGEGRNALIAGVIERFIFPLLFLFLFAMSGNLNLVWWSFTAAEVPGLLVSVIFLVRVFRKKIRF